MAYVLLGVLIVLVITNNVVVLYKAERDRAPYSVFGRDPL